MRVDSNTKIWCDMDQVLVNLLEGADIELAKQGLPSFVKADKDVKWEALKTVPKFWAKLRPMPDGLLLWKFIRQFNVGILSTPSRRMPTTCGPEKKEWIRKHLGKVDEILLVPREKKQDWAIGPQGNPSILIDDHPKNIKEWRSRGGIGILHINTLQTITQLHKLGF